MVQTKKVDADFALLTVGLNLDLSLFFELAGRTFIDTFKLHRVQLAISKNYSKLTLKPTANNRSKFIL